VCSTPATCDYVHPKQATTSSSRQQGTEFQFGQSGCQQLILDASHVRAESDVFAEFLLESEFPLRFD